jgi:hypothetical protein
MGQCAGTSPEVGLGAHREEDRLVRQGGLDGDRLATGPVC